VRRAGENLGKKDKNEKVFPSRKFKCDDKKGDQEREEKDNLVRVQNPKHTESSSIDFIHEKNPVGKKKVIGESGGRLSLLVEEGWV